MDAMIITFVVISSLLCILLLVMAKTGTKGIEKEPYYGRRTGKKYTADKGREDHIV